MYTPYGLLDQLVEKPCSYLVQDKEVFLIEVVRQAVVFFKAFSYPYQFVCKEHLELVEQGVAPLVDFGRYQRTSLLEPLMVEAAINRLNISETLLSNISMNRLEQSSCGYIFESLLPIALGKNVFNGKSELRAHPLFKDLLTNEKLNLKIRKVLSCKWEMLNESVVKESGDDELVALLEKKSRKYVIPGHSAGPDGAFWIVNSDNEYVLVLVQSKFSPKVDFDKALCTLDEKQFYTENETKSKDPVALKRSETRQANLSKKRKRACDLLEKIFVIRMLICSPSESSPPRSIAVDDRHILVIVDKTNDIHLFDEEQRQFLSKIKLP